MGSISCRSTLKKTGECHMYMSMPMSMWATHEQAYVIWEWQRVGAIHTFSSAYSAVTRHASEV